MDIQNLANLFLLPLIVVFGIIAWRARSRGEVTLGLGVRDGAARDFGLGSAIGTVTMVVLFAAILLFGGLEINAYGGDAGMIVALLVYLIVLAIVEEAAFRGLLMTGIAVVVKRIWVAVVITAVLVGIPYFFAEGAGPLGIISGVLSGVMYGAAFVRTGHIWLGAGLRASWNFVQGPLLGFPVSGTMLVANPFVDQTQTGASWLTGGAYGPEASVPGLVLRIAVIAVLLFAVHRWIRTRGRVA